MVMRKSVASFAAMLMVLGGSAPNALAVSEAREEFYAPQPLLLRLDQSDTSSSVGQSSLMELLKQEDESRYEVVGDRLSVIATQPTAFDAGREKPHGVVLQLVSPLFNAAGEVLVPAGAKVEAKLMPTDGGAKIVAKAIVVRNQSFPVSASSHEDLVGYEITVRSKAQKAHQMGEVLGPLGMLGGYALGGQKVQSMQTGEFVGRLLPFAITVFGDSDKVTEVRLAPNQQFLLTLDEPLVVPAHMLPEQSTPEQ